MMHTMNKEKLEQMKKEKLEQMKELGRGGFSKGLSFLRSSANTALTASGSLGGGASDHLLENGSARDESSDGVNAEASTNENGGGKLAYDDLVALSMKLTRQNKLMKTQFQKMQARILECQAIEADNAVLSTFVNDVVGIDLAACQVVEAKANTAEDSGPPARIDARELQERYTIAAAFKRKALTSEIEWLKAQLANVTTVREGETEATDEAASDLLLPMSPMYAAAESVTSTAAPVAVPQYDDIDLISDVFKPTAPTAVAEAAANPFVGGTDANDQSDSEVASVLEKQLDEAAEQLQRMEAEMKRSVAENEELRLKFNELWQQRRSQMDQLTSEKETMEQQISELSNANEAATIAKEEAEKCVSDQNEALELLKNQLVAVTDTEQQLRQRIAELEQIQNGKKGMELASEEYAEHASESATNQELLLLKEAHVKLQAEHRELEDKVTQMEAAGGSSASVTATAEALDAMQKKADALAAENAHLQQQLRDGGVLSSVSKNDGEICSEKNEDPVMNTNMPDLQEQIVRLTNENVSLRSDAERANNDVASVMEELEKVKMGQAEKDHTIRRMQDALDAGEKELAKAADEAEQNTAVIQALRAEVSRLLDDIKLAESEQSTASDTISQLRNELEKLQSSKDEVVEELEMLRTNNTSNLESVLVELSETRQKLGQQDETLGGQVNTLTQELKACKVRCDGLQTTLDEKDKQNQKMATSQAALTSKIVELQKQVSSMEEDLQMAAEGLEAHATRAEQSDLQRQRAEEKVASSVMELTTVREHFDAKMKLAEEKQNMVDEALQESERKCSDLSKKLESIQGQYEDEQKRTLQLETRLGELTAEVGNMSIDLAETKKALSDRMALATRLQTENMGYAEKQAEQAARVENALREAATVRDSQAVMTKQVTEATNQMARMKAERDNAIVSLERLVKDMENEKASMSKLLEQEAVKYRSAVEAEKEAFRAELARVENESKHKSKLAIQAVMEKEAEIERLTARLGEVEEDIRSGDADHRKIFEFAQLQANREMEARANAAQIQALTRELETARSRVNQLQGEQSRHGQELTALMQTQRREGVNMEYLKNVIVQYMSFKPGSSQQTRLIPVITTLLQFTSADIKEVKKASRRSSWASWAVDSVDYKPITTTPTNGRRRTASPTVPQTTETMSMSAGREGTQDQAHGFVGPSTSTMAFDSSSRVSSFALPDDTEVSSDSSRFSPTTAQRADF